MASEQFKAFSLKVQTDSGFQEKIKAASSSADVISSAKEAGFTITADDLEEAHQKLTDEQLESVSGGGGLQFGTAKGIGEALGYGAATCLSFGILPVVDNYTGSHIYDQIKSDYNA